MRCCFYKNQGLWLKNDLSQLLEGGTKNDPLDSPGQKIDLADTKSKDIG